MIWAALACLSAFLIFSLMILQLPYETSIIRTMDVQMQLVGACEHGDERACTLIDAAEEFKQKVHLETANMEGTCLYIAEHGVGIRTHHGTVTSINDKATALLG